MTLSITHYSLENWRTYTYKFEVLINNTYPRFLSDLTYALSYINTNTY